ncbi:hypothetical protein EH30_01205 [Erythrobacter sp. JL475]|nr:hypothetical protein EH30_01205 [Erythrobacter sp. JL475]
MSISFGTVAIVVIAIVLLLLSGVWTDRTYSRFSELPGHYDFRGRATRMAPRRTMAWLLPLTFSLMLAVIGIAMAMLPAEAQNSPDAGLVIASITLLGAQGLVLWLLDRWASGQA